MPQDVNVQTRLDASIGMWRPLPHHVKRVLNFSGDTTLRNVSHKLISIEILPTVLILWTLLELAEQTLNETWPSKPLLLCLNTIELLQHNFIHHEIILSTQTRRVKFSSVSGTSTTDTMQKWLLHRPWLMIKKEKPSTNPSSRCYQLMLTVADTELCDITWQALDDFINQTWRC